MKLSSSFAAGAFAALSLLVVACRDSGPAGTTNITSAPLPPTSPNADLVPTSPAGGTAPESPVPAANTALTDAQILQITHTANAGEIAQAKLARDKSKDVRVKKLALMMLSDHSDADAKGADLAKKENLVLAESPVSSSVKSDGDATLDDLRSRSGREFDKAYVDAQVKEHQAVLDAIDDKLLPNAKDSDVRSFVSTLRPKLAEHLKHARMLQVDLDK